MSTSSPDPAVTVGPAAVEQLWPVRHRVLRPHQPDPAVVLPGDEHPRAVHLAARDASGIVVGSATAFPEAPPWDAQAPHAWRLRGMATDTAQQGHGIGSAVLRHLLRAITAQGATLVWCNARTTASGFYERAGFSVVGDVFEIEGIGPHHRMQRPLP
jgi:ribosomal protein S18 acetylase RimI-like enzyme